MQKPERAYIIIGLCWLVAGTIFGAWLGASGHMNFANSHAHMNLLGFVVSTLFGLLYWAYPQMARSPIAFWQMIIYQAGIVLLIIGKIMVDHDGKESVFLMSGAPITIIGAALMLWLFVAKGKDETRT